MADDTTIAVLLAECDSGKATRRSLAVLYALVRVSFPTVSAEDGLRINSAVNRALGLDTARKVDRFRRLAAGIGDAACRPDRIARQAWRRPVHTAPEAIQ